MQTIYVGLISMNYENVCGYLCFCYADAVDCRELTWMSMDRYGLRVDRYGLRGINMDEYG